MDLRPCDHQVAGHLFEQGKAGCLVDDRGHFYKPIQPGPRGDREKNFYLLVKEQKEHDMSDYIGGKWSPSIMDAFVYIIDGGSFEKAIRKAISAHECKAEVQDLHGDVLLSRMPTFSRNKSILYEGMRKPINVLQKDEFGLVGGTTVSEEDIVWSDDEETSLWSALDDSIQGCQSHTPVANFDWSIKQHDDVSEESLARIRNLPFILRNGPLLKAIPKFHNVLCRDGQTLLELEDVARMYDRPAIMDIKIGKQTWYNGADDAYIERCKLKDSNTTQGELGFKICGMQVFRHSVGGYWRASKKWCKTITSSTVDCALESFVHNENGLRPADVYGGTKGVLHQLSLLEDWFMFQSEFRFFSSSILILYEGKATSAAEANVTIRMVDFAHTFQHVGNSNDVPTRDENYLEGLKSFKSKLLTILNRSG
jgi:hypothetical protein